jgi:hypothetical protein
MKERFADGLSLLFFGRYRPCDFNSASSRACRGTRDAHGMPHARIAAICFQECFGILLRRPLADDSRTTALLGAFRGPLDRDPDLVRLVDSVVRALDVGVTSDRHSQYWWRVLLASLAGIVPPLGLIGFIRRWSARAICFRALAGLAWQRPPCFRLLSSHSLISSASSARIGLRVALTAGVAMGIYAHAFIAGQPALPARREAVNTRFGDLSRPFRDFSAAQWTTATYTDDKDSNSRFVRIRSPCGLCSIS